MINNCEMSISTEEDKISIYLTVNSIYLKNVINKKEEPSISAEIRKQLGPNCLIYRKI